MTTPSNSQNEEAAAQVIWDAIQQAHEAESRGDAVQALHILRSTPTGDPMPSAYTAENAKTRKITLPVAPLVLQAYSHLLALQMGQWGDSPRHDFASDTPHGWLTMYEGMNPQVPETAPILRLWMNRLRVAVASDHKMYVKAAAWSYDQYQLCEEHYPDLTAEAVVNMAVSMSNLGFKATAKTLYDRVITSGDLSAGDLAAVEIRIGDYLWSMHDTVGAQEHYTKAIDSYSGIERLVLADLHNLVRAYARRCDAFLKASQSVEAFSDADAAFDLLDLSRAQGVYESARSVDAAVRVDIANLVDYLTRFDLDSTHAHSVATALSRLGNTSTASRLRRGEWREGAPSLIYTPRSPSRSSAWESRIQNSGRWQVFTDDEVDGMLASDTPLLMTVMSASSAERFGGVTLLAGGGKQPTVRAWELDSSRSAKDLQLLNELLGPPPGVATTESSVWTQPWGIESLASLTSTLFPLDDLRDRLHATQSRTLRIIPVGAMWQFPFACIPIGSAPLGRAVPFVLSPGPTRNVPRPTARHWAGHFDLSLSNTLGELSEIMAAARDARIPFSLIDEPAQLAAIGVESPVSLLAFCGHGQIGQSDQRLLLAGGRHCQAAEFRGLTLGATVILNACWSGYVFDRYGSDPSQQALEFLAAGAHSVLGTIGPISDRRAGQFLHECLPSLAAGMSLSRAYQSAVSRLLENDAERPLASWACYATIGRHTEFETPIEEQA